MLNLLTFFWTFSPMITHRLMIVTKWRKIESLRRYTYCTTVSFRVVMWYDTSITSLYGYTAVKCLTITWAYILLSKESNASLSSSPVSLQTRLFILVSHCGWCVRAFLMSFREKNLWGDNIGCFLVPDFLPFWCRHLYLNCDQLGNYNDWRFLIFSVS